MKLPTIDEQWFVVRTPPNAERLAAEELRIGGYKTYLPMRRKRNFIRRQRLIRDYEEPVIPGYLFVAGPVDWARLHSDIDDREYEPVEVLGKVYNVPKGDGKPPSFEHVGRPLRGARGPLEIPASIVVKIHEDEVAGKYDETGKTKREKHQKMEERYQAGDKYRVTDGPFSGFPAIIEGVTAQDRIVALVTIFGRLAKAEFEPGQLEAA